MSVPDRIWVTQGEIKDFATPPDKWVNPDKCVGEYVHANLLTAMTAERDALAARIAELEAQEKKSRGYRVGHIAGFYAGIRQAAKRYREGDDWDVFATADCAILDLIDKGATND